MKDIEFAELKGKTIESIIRHNGNLIIKFTDDTHAGVYNKDQIIEGELELGFRIYK